MNTGDGEKLQACPIVAKSLIRSKIMFLSSYTLGHTHTYMQMVDSLCRSRSNDLFLQYWDFDFEHLLLLKCRIYFIHQKLNIIMDSGFQFQDLHSCFIFPSFPKSKSGVS